MVTGINMCTPSTCYTIGTKRLPPEIWERIFLHVHQQKQWSINSDLLNCARTCRQFKDILEPFKTTWLFKYVLPHIFPALDKRALLSVREVCKSWKWVMDHFLTNFERYWEVTKFKLPHHRTVQEDFHTLGIHQWLTNFSTNSKLKQFLKQHHPKSRYKSPFPGGSVQVSFQSPIWNLEPSQRSLELLETADQDQTEFWNLFLELLIRVGVNIIFLKIRIRNHGQADRVLNGLAECLKYVPNLMRLYLDIYSLEKPTTLPNSNNIVNLLPSLQHLVCLEFAHTYLNSSGYSIPDHIQCKFAARYLPQLKRLQLSLNEATWNTQFLKVGNKNEIFNVIDLEMKVECTSHFEILEIFQLPDSQPKLRKLTLHLMVASGENIEMRLDQILKYILPFADSLEILNLFCVESYLNRPSNVARVQYASSLDPFSRFCKLKILNLHGFVFDEFCGSFWDTAMPFFNSMPKSLEYFYIQCYHWYGLQTDLQLYSVEYADHIWKVCPNLKSIRIAEEIVFERDNDGNFIEKEGKASIHYRGDWENRKWSNKYLKKNLNQISILQGGCCCTII